MPDVFDKKQVHLLPGEDEEDTMLYVAIDVSGDEDSGGTEAKTARVQEPASSSDDDDSDASEVNESDLSSDSEAGEGKSGLESKLERSDTGINIMLHGDQSDSSDPGTSRTPSVARLVGAPEVEVDDEDSFQQAKQRKQSMFRRVLSSNLNKAAVPGTTGNASATKLQGIMARLRAKELAKKDQKGNLLASLMRAAAQGNTEKAKLKAKMAMKKARMKAKRKKQRKKEERRRRERDRERDKKRKAKIKRAKKRKKKKKQAEKEAEEAKIMQVLTKPLTIYSPKVLAYPAVARDSTCAKNNATGLVIAFRVLAIVQTLAGIGMVIAAILDLVEGGTSVAIGVVLTGLLQAGISLFAQKGMNQLSPEKNKMTMQRSFDYKKPGFWTLLAHSYLTFDMMMASFVFMSGCLYMEYAGMAIAALLVTLINGTMLAFSIFLLEFTTWFRFLVLGIAPLMSLFGFSIVFISAYAYRANVLSDIYPQTFSNWGLAGMMGVGSMTAVMAMFGAVTSLKQAAQGLYMYAGTMLVCLLVLMVIFGELTAKQTHFQDFLEENCLNVVQLISSVYWQSEFACTKYPLQPQLEAPVCANKDLLKPFWELTAVTDDRQMLYSCINSTCCNVLAVWIDEIMVYCIVCGVALLTIGFASMMAATCEAKRINELENVQYVFGADTSRRANLIEDKIKRTEFVQERMLFTVHAALENVIAKKRRSVAITIFMVLGMIYAGIFCLFMPTKLEEIRDFADVIYDDSVTNQDISLELTMRSYNFFQHEPNGYNVTSDTVVMNYFRSLPEYNWVSATCHDDPTVEDFSFCSVVLTIASADGYVSTRRLNLDDVQLLDHGIAYDGKHVIELSQMANISMSTAVLAVSDLSVVPHCLTDEDMLVTVSTLVTVLADSETRELTDMAFPLSKESGWTVHVTGQLFDGSADLYDPAATEDDTKTATGNGTTSVTTATTVTVSSSADGPTEPIAWLRREPLAGITVELELPYADEISGEMQGLCERMGASVTTVTDENGFYKLKLPAARIETYEYLILNFDSADHIPTRKLLNWRHTMEPDTTKVTENLGPISLYRVDHGLVPLTAASSGTSVLTVADSHTLSCSDSNALLCDADTDCRQVDLDLAVFTCTACPDDLLGDGVTGCFERDPCNTGDINGGCDWLTSCVAINATFAECTDCPTGYTGNGWDGCVDIDECATSDPCDTDCHNLEGSYMCVPCSGGTETGTSANTCTLTDSCLYNPCLNNGTCVTSTTQELTYTCDCTAGFDGPRCNRTADACSSNPCANSGLCHLNGTEGLFWCQCPSYPNAHTITCQADSVDNCADDAVVCLNGGLCDDRYGSSVCLCTTGYNGTTCQDDLDLCAVTPCKNGGTCTETGTHTFECACDTGFIGDLCEVSTGDCSQHNCANGGECMMNQFGDAYTCNCAAGYTGETCDWDLDDCASDPCVNDGVCYDMGEQKFICECAGDFFGELCEIDASICATQPCENGGVCTAKATSPFFECACSDPDEYSGADCSKVAACEEVWHDLHCQNGGLCLGQGLCNCTEGYSGSLCEVVSQTDLCGVRNGGCSPVTDCLHGTSATGEEIATCGDCPTGFTGDAQGSCWYYSNSENQGGGVITGFVKDVLFNFAMKSITVKLYKGSETHATHEFKTLWPDDDFAYRTTQAAQDGSFSFDVPPGEYTAVVNGQNYQGVAYYDTAVSFSVFGHAYETPVYLMMAQHVNSDGDKFTENHDVAQINTLRVVLTWAGHEYVDLDLQVEYTTQDGTCTCNAYTRECSACKFYQDSGTADIPADSLTMLSITTSTVYHVSVRLYSADVPAFLSGIDAKVSIYAGEENEPLRVFHVPIEDQDTEENVHWNVFCVNGNLGLHHGIYEMGYTQAATPSQLFTCSSDVEDMRVQTEAFAGSLSDDTQAALDALWPA